MKNITAKIHNRIFNNELLQNVSLTLLLFFAGLVNSRRHIAMINIPLIDKIIFILFGVLFIINVFTITINYFHSRGEFFRINKYWLPLIIIILLKYIILFSQAFYSFITNKQTTTVQIINFLVEYRIFSHIKYLIKLMINLIIISILAIRIDNFSKLNSSIAAFGLGSAIAPIVGLIFFPDLIGRRISDVNGVYFAGSFWNMSVIAFVSSAWLLIGNAHSKENRLKKYIYLFLVMTMFFGGIAGLSRGIVVSGFVSTLVYIICLRDIKKLFKIVAILVVLILIIQLQFGVVFEKLKHRLDRLANIKNEARINIWKDYIEDIKSFFILGASIEGHKVFSKTGHGPHSVLLNWWSQFGIFAVIGFIWLIWGIWKSASFIYKNLSVEQGAAVYAWLFAYLSLSMINETGFNELPFYTAMGIIFAWGNLAKRYIIRNG